MAQYLTVAAAALRLGVTQETVRRWIRDGKLPASRVGEKGWLRINQADLEAMGKTTEPAAK